MKHIPGAGYCAEHVTCAATSCPQAPCHAFLPQVRVPRGPTHFLVFRKPVTVPYSLVSLSVGTFLLYFHLLLRLSLQQENRSSHVNRPCHAEPGPGLGGTDAQQRRPASSSNERLPGPSGAPFMGVPDDSIRSKLPRGFKTIAQPWAV